MRPINLTCIIQSSGDACSGPLCAVLRHPAVSLHSECVVVMRIQVTNNNSGLLKFCWTGLKADLLATGDALGIVTDLTRHAVGQVAAASGLQRWAPGQQQAPISRQRGGSEVAWGAGRS